MNVGERMTSVGSIVVARMQTKKTLSHQLSYFARAYPVAALARIVSTVVTSATMSVLPKYRAKSKLVQAWV